MPSLLFFALLLLGPQPRPASSPLSKAAGAVRTGAWTITWGQTGAIACDIPSKECHSIYRNIELGEGDNLCSYRSARIVAVVGRFLAYRDDWECMGLNPPSAGTALRVVDVSDVSCTPISLEALFGVEQIAEVEWPETGRCPDVPTPYSTSFVITDYSNGRARVLVREPTRRIMQHTCGEYQEFSFRVNASPELIPLLEEAVRARTLLGPASFKHP